MLNFFQSYCCSFVQYVSGSEVAYIFCWLRSLHTIICIKSLTYKLKPIFYTYNWYWFTENFNGTLISRCKIAVFCHFLHKLCKIQLKINDKNVINFFQFIIFTSLIVKFKGFPLTSTFFARRCMYICWNAYKIPKITMSTIITYTNILKKKGLGYGMSPL